MLSKQNRLIQFLIGFYHVRHDENDIFHAFDCKSLIIWWWNRREQKVFLSSRVISSIRKCIHIFRFRHIEIQSNLFASVSFFSLLFFFTPSACICGCIWEQSEGQVHMLETARFRIFSVISSIRTHIVTNTYVHKQIIDGICFVHSIYIFSLNLYWVWTKHAMP